MILKGYKSRMSFLVFQAILPCLIAAQTIGEIKADSRTYLWGEGRGMTLDKADQQALGMLINQISVEVESRFTLLKEELKQAGRTGFSEECRQVVNTYSSATLHNTERIVVSQEPDARVFRYVKRNEVTKIFRQRQEKIIDFARSADKAMAELRMADALKYY